MTLPSFPDSFMYPKEKKTSSLHPIPRRQTKKSQDKTHTHTNTSDGAVRDKDVSDTKEAGDRGPRVQVAPHVELLGGRLGLGVDLRHEALDAVVQIVGRDGVPAQLQAVA